MSSQTTQPHSDKEVAAEVVARQPADADMHAILRELAYAAMVKRGLADADAGRTLTDDEFRKQLTAWQK